MSVINQYFSADHHRLDQLYSAFASQLASDLSSARAYFNAFSQGLLRHIDWEEQVLFPFFEQQTGISQGPTRVMCVEHRQIKQCLLQINNAIELTHEVITSELPAMTELQQILLQHNQKEEQILYPIIDQQCKELAAAQLFLKMLTTQVR